MLTPKTPRGGYIGSLCVADWNGLLGSGLVKVVYWGNIRVESYFEPSQDMTVVRHVHLGRQQKEKWFVQDGLVARN